MTTTSSSSGLTFKLHPLVVVNISDHVTRAKVTSNSSNGGNGDEAAATACVAGCLLGSVGAATRTVDVANSFELVVPAPGAQPDAALLRRRLDQYKQTFPSLDLVGWYAVGPLSQPPGGPGTTPGTIHDALSPAEGSDEAPAPFGLIFDPAALLSSGSGGPGGPSSSSSASASDSASASVRTSVAGLPIRLWEWVPVGAAASDGGGGDEAAAAASEAAAATASAAAGGAGGGGSWAEAPFSIDSAEIERIGVAQAARAVPAGADESGTDQLVGHFKSLHTAVSTMASRIEAIRSAVAAMASGEREVDRGTVRAAAALLKSAKSIGGGGGGGGGSGASSAAAAAAPSSSAAAAAAEADALAMLLLASVTRGVCASASLVEAVAAGAPKAVPEPPAARGQQQQEGGGGGGGTGGGGGRQQRQQRQQQQHSRRDRDRDFGGGGGGSGSGRRRGGSGGEATMVS